MEEEEEEAQLTQFTYSAECPGSLEGKSLFETHCSLVRYTKSTQTNYVRVSMRALVCVNAYLNIPHPKLSKPCLYKSESETEVGRMRRKSDRVLDRKKEGKEEEVAKEERKIFFTL